MGVLEALVDPVLGVIGEAFLVQFPGADKDLLQLAVHHIAVRVGVDEIVVELHKLKLVIGGEEGGGVPKADIGHGAANVNSGFPQRLLGKGLV